MTWVAKGFVLNAFTQLHRFALQHEAVVHFQNNTSTTGELEYADDEVSLLRCPMTPNVGDEIGCDHDVSGSFQYSFHDRTLFVWEKLPNTHEEENIEFVGVSVPLFTGDRHFAGFAIYNPKKKRHFVITDINLQPQWHRYKQS